MIKTEKMNDDAHRGNDMEMIVARDRFLSMDGRQTGLNNNMLVLGASGAGKTRNVLMPNILQCDSNLIVFETKGGMFPALSPILRAHGYDLFYIDFSSSCSTHGYDPLSFVRRDPISKKYDEYDIFSLAKVLCPIEDKRSPFWELAAAGLLTCVIAFACEVPADANRDPNFTDVLSLVEGLGSGLTLERIEIASKRMPDAYFARMYRTYCGTVEADKMHASILGILAEKMSGFSFQLARSLFEDPHQVRLSTFDSNKPVALFVTLNDLDRATAPLADCMITQLLRGLVRLADMQPDGALPRHTRILLDDAGNLKIPDLANILSIVRSREISIGVFTQSLSQIAGVYGFEDAMSIMSNCDVQILLGGAQDVFTARQFAKRLNKSTSSLMETPRDMEWLMVRGQKPELLPIFSLEDHRNFVEHPLPIKLDSLGQDLAPYLSEAITPIPLEVPV